MEAVVAAFNREKALVGTFSMITSCEPSFEALEVTAAVKPSHIVTVSRGNYLGGCLECLKLNNNAVDIFISRLSDKIVESLFRDWHSRCLKAFSC